MAKTISKNSVDTPTNVTATATSGGDLTASTTYYYRVASFRYYISQCVFSAWSSEVSATTDATNKQIDLDWDDITDADGYIIQRSTTSGSYALDGSNTLKRASQSYGTSPCAVSDSYFTDDNNGLYAWTADNLDLTDEIPVIDISSDSNDAITMEDVYDADVAGSWGVINMLAPSGLQSLSNSTLKEKAGYFIKGGLRITDCQFTFPPLLYTFIGTTYCADSVTVTASYSHIFQTSPYMIALAPPDMSSVSYRSNRAMFRGADGSTFNKVVRRPFGIGVNTRIYYDSIYDTGIGGGTWTNCLVGLRSGNQIPVYDADYQETIFEGLRFYTQGISDAILWAGSPSTRWANSKKVDGINVTPAASQDIEMGGQAYSWMMIDPIFRSQTNSAQDNAYIRQIVFASSEGKGVSVACNLDLTVLDTNGNAIEGATVTIEDKYGNNALWIDSGSLLHDNVTDKTQTSVEVDDSSNFSVGDYIRFELNCEIMKITAIPDSTHITVDRAQGSTAAECFYGSKTDSTNKNRIFKNTTSLTTDSNGQAQPDFPLPSRYLETIYQGSYQLDYEKTLEENDMLIRYVYTPHTVTISATGYQTKTMKLTMDRKREEVVVLEKAVSLIHPEGKETYLNLDKENSQNKIMWTRG